MRYHEIKYSYESLQTLTIDEMTMINIENGKYCMKLHNFRYSTKAFHVKEAGKHKVRGEQRSGGSIKTQSVRVKCGRVASKSKLYPWISPVSLQNLDFLRKQIGAHCVQVHISLSLCCIANMRSIQSWMGCFLINISSHIHWFSQIQCHLPLGTAIKQVFKTFLIF